MKITRWGSSACHGVREIEITNPNTCWDKEHKSVSLTKKRIKDFSNGSNHDYEIFINLEEIANLIEVIGEELPDDSPQDIVSALSPKLRQLHRIVNTCIDSRKYPAKSIESEPTNIASKSATTKGISITRISPFAAA